MVQHSFPAVNALRDVHARSHRIARPGSGGQHNRPGSHSDYDTVTGRRRQDHAEVTGLRSLRHWRQEEHSTDRHAVQVGRFDLVPDANRGHVGQLESA